MNIKSILRKLFPQAAESVASTPTPALEAFMDVTPRQRVRFAITRHGDRPHLAVEPHHRDGVVRARYLFDLSSLKITTAETHGHQHLCLGDGTPGGGLVQLMLHTPKRADQMEALVRELGEKVG